MCMPTLFRPRLFWKRSRLIPTCPTTTAFGSYNEMTFNPAEFADGRLNPFTSPKIREAMNWLMDRNYIVQEIYGGRPTRSSPR